MRSAAVSRPRLLIVAGPNGAGKTTVTEAGLAHQWFDGCEYINPDIIAQRELGDWNDPKAVLRAAQLATERREACLRDGRSLAFETVFSGPPLRQGGFAVGVVRGSRRRLFSCDFFFVGTDSPEINAARVARRMLQGGHEVPIRKILDRWARSIANCAAVATQVDRLYVYDNSVEDQAAHLILRANAGTLARRYGPGRPWMASIIAELSQTPPA